MVALGAIGGGSAWAESRNTCPPAGPNVPCPPCTYSASAKYLYGTMDSDYTLEPYPFGQMRIKLYYKGSLVDTVSLGPSSISGGTSVSQSVSTSQSDVDAAVLEWKASNSNTVTQNIPVD